MSGAGVGHPVVLVEGSDGVPCATCGGPAAVYAGKPEHKRGRWREGGNRGPARPRDRRKRRAPAVVVAIGRGQADLAIDQAELPVSVVLRLTGRRAVSIDLTISEARALGRRLMQAGDALIAVAS